MINGFITRTTDDGAVFFNISDQLFEILPRSINRNVYVRSLFPAL